MVTGADRIAANGDTANKIGTYSLSILAAKHNIPFYIGKGTGPRVKAHTNLAEQGSLFPVHCKIRSLNFKYEKRVLIDKLTNEQALKLEENTIADIGRKCEGEGPLLNLSSGGAGPLPSEETKLKISKKHKGKVLSTAHKLKLSKAHMNLSLESRKNMSEAHKGKTISKETRNKISIANTGKKRTLEACIKISQVHKGKIVSLETRKKQSEAKKGRVLSFSTRKKMSIAQSRRRAVDKFNSALRFVSY